jgi:hypothetical protein
MPATIIEALNDPNLFGGMFEAPSWRPWRAFLAALFALPMDDEDLALYRHHTARAAAPVKPSRYAELVVGRRGGKSRCLGLIASYLACVLDHAPYLVPGETAVVAIIAKDRDQAKVILGYVVGFLRSIPLFAELIEDELAETVRLTNRVVIEVHTASIAAPRGRTFLAVLADETAFWPMGDSANPDVEVINAVRPGLSTIPYSLLLVASSPYAKRGILYTNYSKYFGVDSASVLVWQGTTQEMNSSLLGDALIEEMYAEDPDRASAEFGAQFRSDIVAFITREAIESVVPRGIRELPPGGGISYVGFVDPSGGSADSFTLAIAHMEADGVAVLDCHREVRPPFSPDGVVEEFAALLKTYGISRVIGDAYAGMWPRERFSVHGISYDVSKKNKSAIYGEFLPALNGQRVRLLDLPRLIGQLVTLERRTARGGRDSIDHEAGAHDDVANAVCGVLVQVIEDRRPALIRPDDLLTGNAPLPLPVVTMGTFATLAVSRDGTAAAIYAAIAVDRSALILDYDAGPFRGDLFATVAARLGELATVTRARAGRVAIFTEPELVRQAAIVRLNFTAIPDHLLEADDLLLPAASHIAAGRVKLCDPAHERAQTSPFGGALDFRGGDDGDDPLRRAALWAIAVALDPQ